VLLSVDSCEDWTSSHQLALLLLRMDGAWRQHLLLKRPYCSQLSWLMQPVMETGSFVFEMYWVIVDYWVLARQGVLLLQLRRHLVYQ